MVSVKYRIESAINKIQKGQNSPIKDLVNGKRVLNDAIQEVRRISHDLRPRLLDDMGLRVALESLIVQFSERTDINAEMIIDFSAERLPEDIEITIYRLVQEALTNIERHAGVCNVELIIRQSRGQVTLIVEDDGQGFEPTKEYEGEGIGLRNMQERIELLEGDFSIQSKMGEGTRLRAILPSEVT
jgi:two-component system NarL family sensor kinase